MLLNLLCSSLQLYDMLGYEQVKRRSQKRPTTLRVLLSSWKLNLDTGYLCIGTICTYTDVHALLSGA